MQEAAAADKGRHENAAVMDIYDVSATPGMKHSSPQKWHALTFFGPVVPTRKEVQIALAQAELSEGVSPEVVSASEWIATGLRIEETKCVLGGMTHEPANK